MTKGLLFGGAFNPPTKAHIDCARLAMEKVGYDHVLFMPSKEIYIRYDQKKDYVYPDEIRLSMLEAVAQTEKWMQVSDYEIWCDHQPRTYETLCAMKEAGYDCSLLFGSDKLQEFSTAWKYPCQIAEQFGIVCMSRNGLSTQQIIEEDELLRQLKSYIRIVELPQQYQSVSSSYVRELLRQERWEEAAHLLHPSLVQRRYLLRGNL